jgi:hypothetical protein
VSDPKLAQFQRDLGPLLDTNVQTLPLGYYLQGGRHINSEGSRLETLQRGKDFKLEQGGLKTISA